MAVSATDAAARGVSHDGFPTTFPQNSIIELRSGAAAGPGNAPGGTLLAQYQLGASPWAAGSSRGVPLAGVPVSVTGLAGAGSGTNVGHYRLKAPGDTGAVTQNEPRLEGTVTIAGGGGDMTMDNPNLAQNQNANINSFSLGF
jgi:hypothetical protein